MPTLLHRNSKSDTALLLDAAEGDIFVDHGPERTNLSDNTTYISEANSARCAMYVPRNITLKLTMRTGVSGVLAQLGNGGTYSWRVSTSGGEIFVAEFGVLLARVVVPGLAVGSRTILISWSQRLDDSDVVSDLLVYNYTTAEWATARAVHAEYNAVPTDTLTIAAGLGGSSPYTDEIGAFLAVHIGGRNRTAAETKEDWVAESVAPAFVGRDRFPVVTGNAAIATESHLAGPALLVAGAATRQAAHRNIGGFVNVVNHSPCIEEFTASPVHFYRPAPNATTGTMFCLRYLWHGYLSPKCNVAQVRAHITVFDSMTFGPDISPLSFRIYSIAHLNVGQENPKTLTYRRGPIVTFTSASPDGEWIDLGVLPLEREPSGLSYVALAFRVAALPAEGDDFITAWNLNTLTVDPFSQDLDPGGLDKKQGI